MKPELQKEIDQRVAILAAEHKIDPNVIAFLLQQAVFVQKLVAIGMAADYLVDNLFNQMNGQEQDKLEQIQTGLGTAIAEVLNNTQNLGLIAKIPLATLNAINERVDKELLPIISKAYSQPQTGKSAILVPGSSRKDN